MEQRGVHRPEWTWPGRVVGLDLNNGDVIPPQCLPGSGMRSLTAVKL
jgi:hypothetical protein